MDRGCSVHWEAYASCLGLARGIPAVQKQRRVLAYLRDSLALLLLLGVVCHKDKIATTARLAYVDSTSPNFVVSLSGIIPGNCAISASPDRHHAPVTLLGEIGHVNSQILDFVIKCFCNYPQQVVFFSPSPDCGFALAAG